jgi:hypothetical protein
LAATVGQQIEITLGRVGGPQYGTAQVSSPAIRLECVELAGPPNPGGPTFVYIFEATAEGEAQVKIPLMYLENPRLDPTTYFYGDGSCRTSRRPAPAAHIHDAGPSKHRALEERMDEPSQ